MGIWSEYQAKGLWGLWATSLGSSLSLEIIAESFVCVFDSSRCVLERVNALPAAPVFQWQSLSGLHLALYSDQQVAEVDAEFWRILLEYESSRVEVLPTFLPFAPSFHGVCQELNSVVFHPPEIVVFNGQPGTGKRATLEMLCLLHAGARLDSRHEPLLRFKTGESLVVVAPEVAMLEVADQQALLKHIEGGGRFWGATVYDLFALRTRNILQAALAEVLLAAKLYIPPLTKRSPAEIEDLSVFWRAFHGVSSSVAQANLDFQKGRVLGQNALSVESILEEGRGLRGVVAEFEKEAILKAQARVGRSQHKIANLLKISRGSLQHKLRKYHLESYASTDADTENEE